MISFIGRKGRGGEATGAGLQDIVQGYSIEVMPRTAAKIEDFRALLPEGTRVYIAHIEGTPIDEMVATARRLTDEGFPVMPHFPARIIRDATMLEEWIRRYREEAGVVQALLLAGGVEQPQGSFDSSMQMMETGLFDRHGFERLHVAGHPEGNTDIDPAGGTANVEAALKWKQAFAERTEAEMAIVTQFAFDAAPVMDWIGGLREAGIDLPVHVGVAGPAKLQTLIKFAVACGVGPSFQVLKKRAMDVTKLMLPYEPTEVVSEFARQMAVTDRPGPARLHFFPLGGIKSCAEWTQKHGAQPMRAAS